MEAGIPFAPRSCPCAFSNRQARTALFALLFGAASLGALSQSKPASKSNPRLGEAVEQTLAHGHDAVLPPHISHLLGISPDEKEVPVKQFVQLGEPVRGFEVSTEEHNNIVIFLESRAGKNSTFYLLSRRGILRKVLSVKEGVGYDRAPTAADKKDFAEQAQYWLDHLAPLHH